MGRAKNIIVKPIAASDANRVVKAIHYSGKVVNNSQVHLGVFLDGKCGGAMQFGPSLDKRKILGLVRGTLWNEFLELNRMAFADWLPRNGESRAIGYAMRWLKKTYPWLKWVVSFADGTQCGDGTIYRASGFVLTGIKKNNQIWEAPTGEIESRLVMTNTTRPGRERIFSRTSLTDGRSKQQQQQQAVAIISRTTTTNGKHILNSGASSMSAFVDAGWKPKAGFQLRYLYFLDPAARERLTVPILPFSEIERRGAGMYKGKPKTSAGSIDADAPAFHAGEGGSIPTPALQHPPGRTPGVESTEGPNGEGKRKD